MTDQELEKLSNICNDLDSLSINDVRPRYRRKAYCRMTRKGFKMEKDDAVLATSNMTWTATEMAWMMSEIAVSNVTYATWTTVRAAENAVFRAERVALDSARSAIDAAICVVDRQQ